MAKETQVQVKTNVGDQVIARVNSLCEAGFVMPSDYSYVNAVKMSMLQLQELKDKNGRNALEVCTHASIQTALFKMVTKGLNSSLSQCYFLVRGDQLCLHESYFGKVTMVKRIYPDWEPRPVIIHEDDDFEFGIDPTNGRKYVIKHTTKLENIDKDFVGGYIYLPTKDGEGELYMMTKKEIMTAWSKSSSREHITHRDFATKMIGKTLINSGCNMIINSTPQYNIAENEENVTEQQDNVAEFVEAEEVIDAESGEVQALPQAEVVAESAPC
jgi:recombination protein RecT